MEAKPRTPSGDRSPRRALVQHAIFGTADFLKVVGAELRRRPRQRLPLHAQALAQVKLGPREEGPQDRVHPITCATPIIMAEPMGFYKKYGLNAQVVKASSWAMIRDLSINKERTPPTCCRPCRWPSAWASGRRKCPT